MINKYHKFMLLDAYKESDPCVKICSFYDLNNEKNCIHNK